MKALKAHPLFKFLSSLKLAVVSILTLATVLSVATILESFYGMRGAHVLVYGTPWFGGVLFALGLNVFCAALSRFPWKKTQTGFVITHLGIITILVGSFMTQRWGVDGNLPVVEGNQDNETILNDLRLAVFEEKSGISEEYPLTESAVLEKGIWGEIAVSPTSSLVIDQYIPRAVPERRVIESPVLGLGAPALHLSLISSRFQMDEWLYSHDLAAGAVLNLGPAVVKFRRLWSAEEDKKFFSESREEKAISSKGTVYLQINGKEFRVSVEEALRTWIPTANNTLELKIERYLPYAVVEKNELVSRSEEPVNPAVQILLKKKNESTGEPEKHTVFANFPEFTTLHGSRARGSNIIGAKFRFVSSVAQNENMNFVGNHEPSRPVMQ